MMILVVEDEPKIRIGLVNLVQMLEPNSEIYAADNAHEAIKLCSEHFFDIIFTDIKIPGMSGLEMISKIERSGRQIVIVSGYANFEYAQQAIKYGILEYILKPVDPQKIKAVLKKACSKYQAVRSTCLSNLLLNYGILKDDEIDYNTKKVKMKQYSLFVVMEKECELEKVTQLIDSKEFDRIEFSIKHKSCIFVTSENVDSLQSLLEQIKGLELDGRMYSSPISESIKDLYEFLIKRRSKEKNEQESPESNAVTIIKKYIKQNYFQNICLNDLAEVTYMHPTYISKLFKKETGKNLSDYIMNYRMEKAKELLLDPKLKIYEIASSIGFNDSKYFGIVFKSVVGMTPKEFRNGKRPIQ